jgi:hypothetical protein
MTDITQPFRDLAQGTGISLAVEESALRSSGSVVLRLSVDNWPKIGIDSAQTILVELGGVRDCRLIGEGGGARTLAVEISGPLVWDQLTRCSIMGNAPLPDPPRFFLEFSGLLNDLGAVRSASEYLNWRGGFSAWREIVYSRSFLLLTAPHEIGAAATELLENQAAEYI